MYKQFISIPINQKIMFVSIKGDNNASGQSKGDKNVCVNQRETIVFVCQLKGDNNVRGQPKADNTTVDE